MRASKLRLIFGKKIYPMLPENVLEISLKIVYERL